MHLAPLINDLATILGVAAIVTFIFRRIRQPVVLGYIIAGLIVGPYTPAMISIVDLPSINTWAELGVIFLMFALGLEFSFRKLAKVGVSASATGVIELMIMMLYGYAAGKFLGWRVVDSIFLGCMVAISSTTIIIKAFEEFHLKSKLFAQSVFGILIVEDLAAILILVALSTFAAKASLNGFDLLLAAFQLFFVVATWFLAGMFIVPRFVKSVGKHGDNEMLTVLSAGLCLALVTVAAYFQYSVALGAFIMGSILAETREVHRIEELIRPLKDLFGAIFFVSVGMLINPYAIVDNLGSILVISAVIITGKVIALTLGSLATGQTLANSARIGFSMAQIGEFSFIIATLGLTYKLINPELYPIIVAASLITTFTTPSLIRISPRLIDWLEGRLPTAVKQSLASYAAWIQRRQVDAGRKTKLLRDALPWLANAVVVSTIFVAARQGALPWLGSQITSRTLARATAWGMAMILSAPFIWGMFRAFRSQRPATDAITFSEISKTSIQFFSRLMSVLIIGLLSLEFFSFWLAIAVTLGAATLISLAFKRQVDVYYQWFETQFKSNFAIESSQGAEAGLGHLAPWDAHLVSITVGPDSAVIGHSLLELKLRENYGLNVVAIRRGSRTIVAPKADALIFPGDQLLFLGTDEQLDQIRPAITAGEDMVQAAEELAEYRLNHVEVAPGSRLDGVTIRRSQIREKFGGMVVGVERDGSRIFNPISEFEIRRGDALWIVGAAKMIEQLRETGPK